jgi:hypothetical protein
VDEADEQLEETAFAFTLEHVNFAGLLAERDLFRALVKSLEEAVASDKAIGIRPARMELMGGQFMAHCIATLPRDVPRAALREKWRSSTLASFAQVATAKVAALEGMKGVSTQSSVAVSHVSVPMASLLAPFQGHWMRKDSAYVIRGTRLSFESGGVTDIKVSSPNKLSISHPSGLSLNASLECHGRQLRWTNGSVWCRVAAPGPPEVAKSPASETPSQSPAVPKKMALEAEDALQRMRESQSRLSVEQAQVREDQAVLSEKISILNQQLEELSKLREELGGEKEGSEAQISLVSARGQEDQCCMWPLKERNSNAANAIKKEDAMIGHSLLSIHNRNPNDLWQPL